MVFYLHTLTYFFTITYFFINFLNELLLKLKQYSRNMSGNEDIFTAFKFAYYVGKTFGSINYTVKGVPNQRRIVVTKFDNILFVKQFLAMCLSLIAEYFMFVYYLPEYILKNAIYSSYAFCTLFQYLLLPYSIKLTLINRRQIVNIWLNLNRLFLNFGDQAFKDYNYIKNTSICLIILNYIFAFLFLWTVVPFAAVKLNDAQLSCLEFVSRGIILFFSAAMDTELIILLFAIVSIAKILNQNVALISKIVVMREQKKFLHKLLLIHYELFQLGSEINNIFNFLWMKIVLAAGFLSVIVSSYYLFASEKTATDIIFSLIYHISSNGAWFLPLLIIIFLCETTKKEVSDVLYYLIF